MRQTAALLLDAYRELNSRRLFWLTLLISAIVVACFGLVGIHDKGLRIIVWDFDTFAFNTNVISRATFYKMLFFNLGIGFWLTWLATILALVSTAGMIPDFLAGGAIELTLSKPISRLRLFLTKYAAGLLFVALQVLVFAVGSFLVIGLRGGVWEPGVFLSVPIVVVFFSYLFCVCALLGVLTRSTVASLLLTLVVWFVVSMLGNVEALLLTFKTGAEKGASDKQAFVDGTTARLERLRAAEPSAGDAETVAGQIAEAEKELEQKQKDLDESQGSLRTINRVYSALYVAKTVLPKTKDTTALLDRSLIADSELEKFLDQQTGEEPRRRAERGSARSNRNRGEDDPPDFVQGVADPETAREAQRRVRNRPLWWVLGTSLAFEAAVLALASWIFVRRDF